MEGFWQSLKPFFKVITKKYKIEAILIIISLIIAFVSLVIFVSNSERKNQTSFDVEENSPTPIRGKILVDIAGAVVKPDLYEATIGSRIKDILLLAGGLSEEADKSFFYRNYNLARLVNDQEKIYIPSTSEINNGIVTEIYRTLDYTAPQTINYPQTTEAVVQTKININQATIDELDTLPGIGQATAQKIIQNQPYQAVNDLVTKKAVTNVVFNNIKDLVSVN
jgi:competence protein ComEA